MRLNVSQWVLIIGPYASLCVLIGLCRSLCLFKCLYGSVLVLMRPYVSF